MRKTIARALLAAGLLNVGLLLTGCGRDQQATLPDRDMSQRPTDAQILQQPREPHQSHPASVVFVEYVVTPHDVVAQMLKLADVRSDDVVYDLGCGDGRILVAAAKEYGCRAVGYDLDPLRVAEAQANAGKSDVADRVTVEQKDVLTVDLQPATVVTIYLGTELNRKLVPQLEQLRPGSRIVSHNFGLPGFVPDKVIRMTSHEDHEEHLIYLWTCPLKKAP